MALFFPELPAERLKSEEPLRTLVGLNMVLSGLGRMIKPGDKSDPQAQ